jgi:pimeloyl-ACP methyl ester carboxylesterase
MGETDVARGERLLRVRDAGDPDGRPVVYFHGTPGSRLDLTYAEDLAAEIGVRLVSFDRPGYGGSTAARFGLVSVAEDAAAVADSLGIDRFATLGQSGGGPFSLATAAVLGDRVTRAGVTSGPGPFTLVPGAFDDLDEGDKAALAMLPDDPDGAAKAFADGFGPIVSLCRDSNAGDIAVAFGEMQSDRDRVVIIDERVASEFGNSMKEGLRPGPHGCGWDNVAWVGPWEIDPSTIHRQVFLWYGDEDRLCAPSHGFWLRDHVPGAEFVLRAGEGHAGLTEHTAEVLTALTR